MNEPLIECEYNFSHFFRVHCQLVPLFGNGGENRDLGKNGSTFWSSNNKVHSISTEQKNIINGQTADISVNAIEQTS